MKGDATRDVTRRTLLGASTIGAAGCIGGPNDQPSQQAATGATATTGDQPAPTTQTRTPIAPSSESGRIGDMVYYDSKNRGPYADLQQALADVPDAGTLWIAQGHYNVASEGTITLDRPVHIRGAGWTGTARGTELDNGGDDVVDEPVIAYESPSDADELKNVSVRDLDITHQGNAPAVRFTDVAKSLLKGCSIGCWGGGPVGVKYEGRAYLARCFENKISTFSDTGIHVESIVGERPAGGYGHEFFHNVATTSQAGATALRTERPRTLIVGGEYMVNAENGTALEFYNPISEGVSGGLVIEPGLERTPNSIVIDGESPFDNVQIYHTFLPVKKKDRGTGVQFKNARDCKLIYPIVDRDDNNRHLVQWYEESKCCSVVTDPDTLTRVTYTDDGATNPHIQVDGTTPDAKLRNYPTGVPTTVAYNPDANGPVFHDGSEWRRIPSESYSP